MSARGKKVRRQTVVRLDEFTRAMLAQEIAAILRPQLLDKDPEFTRKEAAIYCRMSTREFDRERGRYPDDLQASREERPVLFRRSTLDVYRARRPALHAKP